MNRKLLFTPGPLNTSAEVKQAMLRDAGSRDGEFIELVRRIREQLLALGGASQAGGYEAVLIQGSGTFGVEAVLSSIVPNDGRVLILANGAYGERMVRIAARHGLEHQIIRWPENTSIDPEQLRQELERNAGITHIAAVHCETSTGLLNPAGALGRIVQDAGRTFILDAMSSFGALPLDLGRDGIDFLISSANKCIQGVPGFSFVLARRGKLEAAKGRARTLSLDLYEQWRGLEADGQFRFTPPTHALLAFGQALQELREEGGATGRQQRYTANHDLLVRGMRALGFVPYLDSSIQAPIITAFLYPGHSNFRFEEFYARLAEQGMIIYPGKLTEVACFRLGNIGHLFEEDIQALLRAIESVLRALEIPVPVPPPISSR